jgi:hypothetical protein
MISAEYPPLVEQAKALARAMGFPLTRQEAVPGAASASHAHDPKRELFRSEHRLVAAEVVLPDLQNSLLVGARIA